MVLHSALGGYKTLRICSNAQDWAPPKVNFLVHKLKMTKGTKEIEQVTCAFCEVECKELDRAACKAAAGIRSLISSAGFCSFNCSDARGLESANPGILRAE